MIQQKPHKKRLNDLEIEKNIIESKPIINELSKVETLIKNDVFNDRLNYWQERYKILKEKKFPLLSNMILDAEFAIDRLDYKEAVSQIAKIEMEIYKVANSTDVLLSEIREITLCEEKNRTVITKFKVKYRELLAKFKNSEKAYGDIAPSIEIQFENINKLFVTFEKVMEKHEYDEAGNVIKAIDDAINHMDLIIEEVPSIMLMLATLLPSKIRDVQSKYNEMMADEFCLDYMNFEYNLAEINKMRVEMLGETKMLNIGDSVFELKIIIDFLDSLFIDFENEIESKKNYKLLIEKFEGKFKRINVILKRLYQKISEVEESYTLKAEDLDKVKDIEKDLKDTEDSYEALVERSNAFKIPFSKLENDIVGLNNKLSSIESILESFLEKMANMFSDENRAREELVEIKEILFKAREKIRAYKLPVIENVYYVQLKEAEEAVKEILKELSGKPINIETLNTRVDTARDLVLKLLNTTNGMVKTAMLAEMSIVYGNRYRSNESMIDKGLNNAEVFFNHGDYKKALETSIMSIKIIEPNIREKMLEVYKTRNI